MLKALLKIALLAVCLLPTLSACSGDEPKTPEDNLPAETKKFVGKWEDHTTWIRKDLTLHANGECFYYESGEDTKEGEWTYDKSTKILSTTAGFQAIVTILTDNAWTGYSLTGKVEYHFTRAN